MKKNYIMRLDDACQFISTDNMDSWIDTAFLMTSKKDDIEKCKSSIDVINAGFDIKSSAKNLGDFYKNV